MRGSQKRVLIIGADGLRPDMITREQMPVLTELMENGTRYSNFKSAYPSETRVSMSTLTTGVYPGKHGIVANLMYMPGFKENFVQTGNHLHLLSYEEETGEPILMAPTLGDRLNKRGMQLSAAASSSPGASLLWNIHHPEKIINPATDYGQSTLAEIHKKYATDLTEDIDGVKRKKSLWALQAFISEQLKAEANRVLVLWLAEPDSSQHYYGLGSRENLQALRMVDECLKEVLDHIKKLGMQKDMDILFLSDHGHSTVEAIGSLTDHVEKACVELNINNQFTAVGNYIYGKHGTAPAYNDWAALIRWLQRQDWCGTIYTDKSLGKFAGVSSIEEILGPITHNRAPELIINPVGTNEVNEHGIPGKVKTLTDSNILRASHGTMSPYDRHAVCIGSGPSFERGKTDEGVYSIVDIAPTICEILGLDEDGFDGRSLLNECHITPTYNR